MRNIFGRQLPPSPPLSLPLIPLPPCPSLSHPHSPSPSPCTLPGSMVINDLLHTIFLECKGWAPGTLVCIKSFITIASLRALPA
jgi:hypothetical protein